MRDEGRLDQLLFDQFVEDGHEDFSRRIRFLDVASGFAGKGNGPAWVGQLVRRHLGDLDQGVPDGEAAPGRRQIDFRSLIGEFEPAENIFRNKTKQFFR